MGVAVVTAVLLTVFAVAVVVWLTSVTEWWLPFFVVAFAVAGFQADKRRRRPNSRRRVVVAHEPAHIANRDAWVMTVVGGPPTRVLAGIREYWESRDGWWWDAIRYAVGVALLGSWLAALSCRKP